MGLLFVEHAIKDGIRPARSYGTTPMSYKETKPRNAKEILRSIFVFGFSIPM